MKEVTLRKWHRNLGILLAIFIVLQVGSGLLISLEEFSVPHTHADEDTPKHVNNHISENTPKHMNNEHRGESIWHEYLEFIHHGGGKIGSIYRVLLGLGLAGMVISGSMIFFKIRARSARN